MLETLKEATEYVRTHGSKPPVEEVTVVGGVIRRSYRIKAGNMLLSDVHDYDHLSILLSGEAILECDGAVRTLVGPCFLEIKAGIEHALYAITDCEWDCLHALAVVEAHGSLLNREGL